ncbi:hypothetical protein Ahy_A06g028061 [Arachis hypogaea]|uniref:Transposase-associated domain-containing protein n=1 Tax=Arachis hypogaea TaxID=3818 RepID=A0A445CQA2_ARAHY|nr:hypothetical protein Ahy_A06g028061 [Arachis hypogaea]
MSVKSSASSQAICPCVIVGSLLSFGPAVHCRLQETPLSFVSLVIELGREEYDIDKSWISKARVGAEYRNGLTRFLDFSFANASSDGMIRCPCPKCGFRLLQNREDAFDHLVINPFPSSYTFWIHHGERRGVESSGDEQEDQSEQNF